MTTPSEDRPPLADEVAILLQRAFPGSVEKEELIDTIGVDGDELRETLVYLEEAGELDLDADNYRWRDPEADGTMPPAETDEEHEQGPVGGEEPGPAMSSHVRIQLTVTGSFASKPTDSDHASAQKAQSIAHEIGNALAVAFPKLAFDVQVARVEAFDKPRVIWPPATGE